MWQLGVLGLFLKIVAYLASFQNMYTNFVAQLCFSLNYNMHDVNEIRFSNLWYRPKTSLKQNKKINLYADVNWTMQQLQILFGP